MHLKQLVTLQVEQNQIVSETIQKFSEEVRKLKVFKGDDYVNSPDLLDLLPLNTEFESFIIDDVDYSYKYRFVSCEIFLTKTVNNWFGFDDIHAGTLTDWQIKFDGNELVKTFVEQNPINSFIDINEEQIQVLSFLCSDDEDSDTYVEFDARLLPYFTTFKTKRKLCNSMREQVDYWRSMSL